MDQGRQGRSGIRMTSHWGAALLLVLLSCIGMGEPAWAQTAPQFCYQGTPVQCFDTLDKAERAMREAPANASISTLLEAKTPVIFLAQQTAQYPYGVKDQPATPLYAPSYQTGLADGSLIQGGHGCTPTTDPNKSTSWCSDEAELLI
jgi:hypothetical protein